MGFNSAFKGLIHHLV